LYLIKNRKIIVIIEKNLFKLTQAEKTNKIRVTKIEKNSFKLAAIKFHEVIQTPTNLGLKIEGNKFPQF